MKYRSGKIVIYKNADDRTEVVSFSLPETYFDFIINSMDSKNTDACVVSIYGVDRSTYSSFKLEDITKYSERYVVEIYLGYSGNDSLIYKGVVSRLSYAFNGGRAMMKLVLDDGSIKFNNVHRTISISEKQPIIEVLKTIASSYDYTLFVNKQFNEALTINRYSFTGSCKDAIDSLLPEYMDYWIKNNHIYVWEKTGASKEGFKKYSTESPDATDTADRYIVVHVNNGLLEYPNDDTKENKYKLKTILVPEIKSGLIIKIPVDNGWYASYDSGVYEEFIVDKFNSSFSDGFGYTEMECSKNDKQNSNL